MHPDADDLKERPIPELLSRLANETSTLVRQELELARTEMLEKGKDVGASAGMFSASVVFGLGAFGAVTTFLIALIALALPVWAAALIVTVVYGLIAFIAAQRGKKKLEAASPLAPEQTAQTVKEDVAWAKTRVKSGRR